MMAFGKRLSLLIVWIASFASYGGYPSLSAQNAVYVDLMGATSLQGYEYEIGRTPLSPLVTHHNGYHVIGGYWTGGPGPLLASSEGTAGSMVNLFPFANPIVPTDTRVTGIYPLDSTRFLVNTYRYYPVADPELWVSDGTQAGTAPVTSLNYPESKIVINKDGKTLLWNTSRLGDYQGDEFIVTDGTTAGTMSLWTHPTIPNDVVFETYDGPFYLNDSNDIFFHFRTDDQFNNNTSYLFKVAGDLSSMELILNPTQSMYNDFRWFPHKDKAYFVIDAYTNGMGCCPAALYVTDGTPGGTYYVKDMPLDRGIKHPFVLNDSSDVFFLTHTFAYPSLWKTDGTIQGTQLVTALGNNWPNDDPVVVNGKGYFIIHKTLWETDGTAGGTQAVYTSSDRLVILNKVEGGNGVYFCDEDEMLRYDPSTGSVTTHFPIFPSDHSLWNIEQGDGFQFITIRSTDGANPVRVARYINDDTPGGSGLVNGSVSTLYRDGISEEGFFQMPGQSDQYLLTHDGHRNVLYRTDGTLQGTFMVEPNVGYIDDTEFAVLGDQIFMLSSFRVKVIDSLGAATRTLFQSNRVWGLGTSPGDSVMYFFRMAAYGEVQLFGIGPGTILEAEDPIIEKVFFGLRNNPGPCMDLWCSEDITLEAREGVTIQIVNGQGSILLQGNDPAALRERSYELPDGLYFVKLVHGKENWTGKWLKR